MLQAPDRRAEGSWGAGECGHGVEGGQGERGPFALGDLVPCPWLSPLHPPTGLPHPEVLEKGWLVPAGAGQGGGLSPFPALRGCRL